LALLSPVELLKVDHGGITVKTAIFGAQTAQVKRIQEITGIPGFSVGVNHEGKEIWKLNLGYRDVERKLSPTSDTVFNLNSLTKSSTAAAFGLLVKEGKIDWDTPIKTIFPEFARGCDAFDQTLTTVDLLSMRSGHEAYNSMSWQGHNIILDDRRDRVWCSLELIADST
jgi:CubicO group peptidase (beta-lactamase class C family)